MVMSLEPPKGKMFATVLDSDRAILSRLADGDYLREYVWNDRRQYVQWTSAPHAVPTCSSYDVECLRWEKCIAREDIAGESVWSITDEGRAVVRRGYFIQNEIHFCSWCSRPKAKLGEPLHDPHCYCIGSECEQKPPDVRPEDQIRELRQENAALRHRLEKLERLMGAHS